MQRAVRLPPRGNGLHSRAARGALRGRDADFSDVALDMEGISLFNARVYEFVRTIPRGATRTYDEVAAGMRRSGAEFSVAQAIGKNPFMIVVPCHRIVGSSGSLTGYAGGLERKRALLQLEGALLA